MLRFSSLVIVALVFSGNIRVSVSKADQPYRSEPQVGAKLSGFELTDGHGSSHTLDEFRDRKLVVLVFLGTECPLAKLYLRTVSEIASDYADKSVAVIGVDANIQDGLTEILRYTVRHQLDFPLLKDVENRLADQIGAVRTPEAFLLDESRTVRYWGKIDDQYGVDYRRDAPKENYLREAIEALLKGESVVTASVTSVGCRIGRRTATESKGDVTYANQISRILNQRCIECHRSGQIAPFSLTSYQDTKGWGETILEVIETGRMPPWNANPKYGVFKNDLSLSDDEKGLIRTWVENGMPKGDLDQLPAKPRFSDDWRIDQPDQIIYMRENKKPFSVPADGVVDYQYFSVDPGWTEDKYIVAAEAKPGNFQVVHHIVIFVWPPRATQFQLDAMLVGYAPGALPTRYEAGQAMYVPAGSKLVFEMHYTPNGRPQEDLSYVGVKFAQKSTIDTVVGSRLAINDSFTIPANAGNHVVQAEHKIGRDCRLLHMTPHMHLRGKSFTYEAEFPDGTTEILLEVPNYDFNWQLTYTLRDPKPIPAGTVIRCTAVYDNSEENLSNPDPTQSIRWGQQSWDEMMIGFFTTIPETDRSLHPSIVDPSGTWVWEHDQGGKKISSRIEVQKQAGDAITGKYKGLEVRRDILNARLNGDRLTFDVPVIISGRQLNASFDGRVRDTAIEGNVTLESGFGSRKIPWRAIRRDDAQPAEGL